VSTNARAIEPVNFEVRTERRSVTCSSGIFQGGDRISGSCRFAKLLRVTDSRSGKESSWGGEFELNAFGLARERRSDQSFEIRKFNPLGGAVVKLRHRSGCDCNWWSLSPGEELTGREPERGDFDFLIDRDCPPG